MRKRWLGTLLDFLLVAAILLLGLLVGTAASANTIITQKVELRSFLEKAISIYRSDIDPRTNERKGVVKIKTRDIIVRRSYTLEFVPKNKIELSIRSNVGINFLTIWTDYLLKVTPEDNVEINGKKITLSVNVGIVFIFDNLEDLLEFQKEIIAAINEDKRVSVEAKVGYNFAIVDEKTIKEENHYEYEFYFSGSSYKK